jgi:GABA(A) receptor-associated protein
MDNYTLSEKIEYSCKLSKKYPDRIPVIVEKSKEITLTNYKYLLPKQITVSTFLSIIRTKMNITENQALFTFVKTRNLDYVMVPMSETISSVFETHRSEDGFLYIRFSVENTFG